MSNANIQVHSEDSNEKVFLKLISNFNRSYYGIARTIWLLQLMDVDSNDQNQWFE